MEELQDEVRRTKKNRRKKWKNRRTHREDVWLYVGKKNNGKNRRQKKEETQKDVIIGCERGSERGRSQELEGIGSKKVANKSERRQS